MRLFHFLEMPLMVKYLTIALWDVEDLQGGGEAISEVITQKLPVYNPKQSFRRRFSDARLDYANAEFNMLLNKVQSSGCP